ncbi:MAG: CpaF family protein, partial [Roseobacter sp.]|nr:CpaF family protein [Roseobacter sp.]
MFSRYKKDGTTAKSGPKSASVTPLPQKADAPEDLTPKPKPRLRRPTSGIPAQAGPVDKEAKRRERIGELKLELHRELLDSLNLAALDTASEADLRAEINAITDEVLSGKNVVLNRDDRATLNKELFDEVKGLGPLETLLQDETVNDILVNGPKQIFVERAGKLMLTD